MLEKKKVPFEGGSFAVHTTSSNGESNGNVFGWNDEETYRARVWAIFDEQFEDYLDDIRMVGEFAGDVLREPPTRPMCPRPRRRV